MFYYFGKIKWDILKENEMAQIEIAEILNNMREENQRNMKNFEKLLSGINKKLEVMEEDNEAVDLVKFYITELKNVMENRFSASMIKYDAFEASFDGIVSVQSKLAKTSELQDLFKVFISCNDALKAEILEQKNQLDVLDEKLLQIDKKSIYRDELVSMVQSVSLDLTALGENIQKSLLLFEDNIKNLDVPQNLIKINQTVEELKQLIVAVPDYSNEFAGIKKSFANIISDKDFSDFKGELADFVQKIIDNSLILNSELKFNTERILEAINSFDFSELKDRFDVLKSCLDELSADNHAMSEGFQEKFKAIKELVEAFDNSEEVKYKFENFERAFSQILTTEEFNHFKTDFADFIQKIIDNSNVLYENSNFMKSQLSDGVEKFQSKLADLSFNVQSLRDIVSQQSVDFKGNMEQCTNDALERINSNSKINFADLKGSLENIISELTEIKDDFARQNDTNVFNISSGFNNIKLSLENIVSALNLMGATKESILEVNEKINNLNDMISAISSDLLLKQHEIINHISDVNELHNNQIKTVSENVNSLKSCIDEAVVALKDYLSELEISSNNKKNESYEKITQKLLDLESSFVQNACEYEQKMELLQTKIIEFAHIVENSNSDTEGKIASSLDEITKIKDELILLDNALKSSHNFSNEKLSEIISLIDAGIENIIFSMNNLNGSLVNDIDASIKENFTVIDEKFDKFVSLIAEMKEHYSLSNVDLIQNIENKISVFKDELALVNVDISQAIQSRTEDIVKAVDTLKVDVDALCRLDFDIILSDLKEQLEISFMNFSVDIHNDFVSNSEVVSRLERAIKEVYNKFVAIEAYISDKFQNNIEQLNIVVENGINNAKLNFEGKIEENINELKNCFNVAFNNINVDKSFIKEQLEFISDNNGKTVQMLSTLKEKVDMISSDTSLHKELSIVEKKVIEMLNVLHAKVDIFAEDSSSFDILDEIENVKEIIFEQRKFFEVSSNEKASAIDKCLADVLFKLDNLDIEKNVNDVRDTILNVLVSLVEQISFVEETEEIKDFVEEKTDEINQNLIEVQNQLKQLTNLGDDFDYKYSLQDVETDIAKLRLAISNMSGNDFSDVTDEIKKIVDAVEGLENSLTQEQIVDLKSDIEKLNEDIVSISSRTNKLLLTSDESYKALNEGLNNFSNVIYKLEDRINYLDNTEISERIERKIDNIHSLAVEADNANKVSRQVMMYLGEWIDSAGENISVITEKTAEIDNIKESIQQLKEAVPEKSDILNAIEKKFEQQEERLDRLEMKLEKVLSTLEEKDDMVLNRKVDNIENLLSGLGKNIEKLASYVDEE